MAAFLFSLIAQKLTEAAADAPSDCRGHIHWLENEFRRLQSHFKDDSVLEMRHKKLRKCASDLTSLAQETDFVLENYRSNIQLRKHGLKDWCRAGRKFSREMLQIKEKMVTIFSDMPSVKEEEEMVVGFDEQVDKLLKLLNDGRIGCTDLCILGEPGSGKTTLLRKVYNHDSVKSTFEKRAWISHSTKESHLRHLTRTVTRYTPEEIQSMDEESMYRKVSDSLKGSTYLVVLDFNIQELSTWDRIKGAFPEEKNGSRILLTSHLKAHEFDSKLEVREIGPLSQDELWKLFGNTFNYEEAAAGATSSSTSTVLSTLERFVRDRWHLPSEIVNLGAILSTIYERTGEFSDVIKFLDEIEFLEEHHQEVPSGIISGIASKYNQLEGSQKLLFSYLGLFPQGFEIPARRLVQLWLAEGWIQNEEVMANKCLTEMARQNMIQGFRWATIAPSINSSQRVKACGMDNILREFSLMKAWQLNLYKIYNYYESIDSKSADVSRLSLQFSDIFDFLYLRASFPNLRALICFPVLTTFRRKAYSILPSLGRFKLLKILDLENIYISQLPEDIGKELTELRYLGLRRTGLERLPASLGNFKKLQTLDIKHTLIRGIPISIQKLKCLQYLYMDMDDAGIDGISPDLSSLNHLRVLSVIRAGEWMTDGLRKLTNLRKLGIYGDLGLCRNALPNVLTLMHSVESLRVGFGVGDIDLASISLNSDSIIQTLHLERPLKKLPERAKFPNHLTRLYLKWSQLEQDPMGTLGKLPYLKILKLFCSSFLGKKIVCTAGGFPLLEVLELSMLTSLEEWIVQEGAMPALNHLVIHVCKRLKMLPEGLKDLRKLGESDVAGMPLEFTARLQQSMGMDWNQIFKKKTGKDWSEFLQDATEEEQRTKLQDSMGKDWHKIQHVRYITVDGILIIAGPSSSSSPSPLSPSYPINQELARVLLSMNQMDAISSNQT